MPVQAKHFLNSSSSLVLDNLEGLCAFNPQIALDRVNKVVHIASPNRSKVGLLCGGGSGHEPAHAGFVGKGMLNAAVCGSVFASPNARQVRRGIELVDNDKGTVIIVKNYTGDVLNFGLAKEQNAALHPDKADKLKFVVVGDDVAVGKTQGSIVGRRGLAGTVLVYKIAGALAERGGSLDEVYRIAQFVSSRVGTIGVGLEHCHIPGAPDAESHLDTNEVEIGMGIHNESGHRRISPIPPLKELIPMLLDLITSTVDEERSFLPFKGNGKDDVVLLVNNLGGLSELELGCIVGETRQALEARNITIYRVLSGNFMSSLNMPGFSLTLLLLPFDGETRVPERELLLSLLNDKPDAPGWKWTPTSKPVPIGLTQQTDPPSSKTPQDNQSVTALKASDSKQFIDAIQHACHALITSEPEITRLDTIAGDGDCGQTLKAGAEATIKKITEGAINGSNLACAIISISQVAEEVMGGTSGALYSIFFSALAQSLRSERGAGSAMDAWGRALKSALGRLYTYTRVRPPSRTLVDPLAAFVEAFPQGLSKAVVEASEAAVATKDVNARAGRSAYVDSDRLKKEQVADPGAWGVKVILESLVAQD